MTVLWPGDICLRRVKACSSSVLQGTLSMLQHYHCAYQRTDFPWQSLFHVFVSNLCSAVMCFLPQWIHPSSTLSPDCCALTSVLQGCSACMQSHTNDCADLKTSSLSTERAQLGGISFWVFQSQSPPSAADLLHSLDPSQHCTMQIYTTQGSFWNKSI